MQDDIEDKYKEYFYFPHQYWYDLLSTLEMKNSHNRYGDQMKILANYKSDPANSDRNVIPKVNHKNNAMNSILLVHKQQGKK